MNHPLHSYFNRRVTFMFVPHEGGKPFHLRLPLPFLHGCILLLLGLVAWALTVVSRDVRDAQTLARARRMEDRLKDIETEMKANQEALQRMAGLDSQMRQVLRLKNPRKAASFGPMGGPTAEDDAQLSKLLDEKNEELMNGLSLGVKALSQEAQSREQSYREIQLQLDKQRSLLASTPSIWPVKGWITSGFGRRMSPLTGEPGRHMGVDIANEINTPIRVTADGVVTYAGWESGYGRLVVIEHGFGFSTRYGHCARLAVKVGQQVKRGDVVGYIGSSGRSTGSHCHYEVRVHGLPVDPMKYLPTIN